MGAPKLPVLEMLLEGVPVTDWLAKSTWVVSCDILTPWQALFASIRAHTPG